VQKIERSPTCGVFRSFRVMVRADHALVRRRAVIVPFPANFRDARSPDSPISISCAPFASRFLSAARSLRSRPALLQDRPGKQRVRHGDRQSLIAVDSMFAKRRPCSCMPDSTPIIPATAIDA